MVESTFNFSISHKRPSSLEFLLLSMKNLSRKEKKEEILLLAINFRNCQWWGKKDTVIWEHTSRQESWVTSTFLEEEERMKNYWAVVSNTASNKVLIVLISLEKWRDITPMKCPRSTGFSLIFKSKIYVFGGYTGEKKRSKLIEVYDPFKNYWETLNVFILR